MTYEVHWEEGLFLRPQHFQMLQRNLTSRASEERSWHWPHAYGVVISELAQEELANGWVQFRRFVAVTRQGVVVDYPSGAELPRLHVGHELEEAGGKGVVVYLAVPLYDSNRSNSSEAAVGDSSRLWRVDEIEDVPDENRGRDGEVPVPVRIRRVNAMLLSARDGRKPNAGGMELIPLLRVERTGAGEGVGLPRIDAEFVPPCLVLTGSPLLRGFLSKLANQIESAWRQMAAAVVPSGGSVDTLRGAQQARLLRALVLGRYAPRLLPLVRNAAGVSPFGIYLELRSLVAELGVLAGEGAPLDRAVEYDHDNPFPAFKSLGQRVGELLGKGAERKGWDQSPFENREGVPVAMLTAEQLANGVQFFLGVRSSEEPRTLASLIEDENGFRLLSLNMRRGGAFFGVRLRKSWDPPAQFPGGADRHYFEFRLDESQRVWERVKADGGVVIDSQLAIDGRLKAEDAAVYMTLP